MFKRGDFAELNDGSQLQMLMTRFDSWIFKRKFKRPSRPLSLLELIAKMPKMVYELLIKAKSIFWMHIYFYNFKRSGSTIKIGILVPND